MLARSGRHLGEETPIRSIFATQTQSSVDFVELYNPGNFTANKGELVAGTVIDCEVNPHLDLTSSQEVATLIEREDPLFLIGAPPCTVFSSMQNINQRHNVGEAWELKYQQGLAHLEYAVQYTGNRFPGGDSSYMSILQRIVMGITPDPGVGATTMPKPLPYLSITVVLLTDGEELSPHKDVQNHRLHQNATISFGKWTGGVLQILEDDKWINCDSRDQWAFLNARDAYHRVTEVTGYRLSAIYHTPQHLHRLTSEDWESLRENDFPVDAVWECGMSTHAESDDDSDVLPKVNVTRYRNLIVQGR